MANAISINIPLLITNTFLYSINVIVLTLNFWDKALLFFLSLIFISTLFEKNIIPIVANAMK